MYSITFVWAVELCFVNIFLIFLSNMTNIYFHCTSILVMLSVHVGGYYVAFIHCVGVVVVVS